MKYMSKIIISIVVFSFFLPKVVSQDYVLVWSDEFNNSIGNGWLFESGRMSNNELQYYRRENASIENGNLVITAKRENYGGANYTSARLRSQLGRSFRYGRIEARIRVPGFIGSWPAFWLLSTDYWWKGWPACGEIDILEQVNNEHRTHGYMHWADVHNQKVTYGNSVYTDISQYHVYSIEWDEFGIRFFRNGEKYIDANITNGINNTHAFHSRYDIILNLAVGGDWPGYYIDNNALPGKMYVDYVRVYQKSVCGDKSVKLPARIEAEDYCLCSGMETQTTTDVNGALHVGWIQTGDWLTYRVDVPQSGKYRVRYRVASNSIGNRLQLEKAGGEVVYGIVNIPNTGGWDQWQTVSHIVDLEEGVNEIGVATPTGGFNLNWISFDLMPTTDIYKPVSDNSNVVLYPNPAQQYLSVIGSLTQNFSIYNTVGRKILETSSSKINVESFEKGVYIIKVDGKHLKFVKE
jgi:beta-glucanase (GH16 family)